MMDSSNGMPDSPMEQDEALFPCKGCGEILEEGKAFELAGNRWHIDCFRCNTCGTILDSDANLLLLGDGSLICNNCTYSCSVCGNKIEDLAILTGDQAFCAACFKCRNCKKKIENLKYARTSQGIFCMECHESLMQRRRKKGQKNGSSRHKHPQQPPNNTRLLDKSLPSLPPSAADQSALAPDAESPPSDNYSETPTELPPHSHVRPSNNRSRSETGTPGEGARPKRPSNLRSPSSRSEVRERSPLTMEEERKENLMLPSSTYSNNRQSTHSQRSEGSNGEGFFIPMALDPNPVPGPLPLARREHNTDLMHSRTGEHRPNARDYFNAINSASRKAPIESDKENRDTGFSPDSPADSRNSSQPNSPHIAYQYQDRGRKLSSDITDQLRKKKEHPSNTSQDNRQDAHHNESRLRRQGENQGSKFMLQEAPKKKRNSKSEPTGSVVDTGVPSSKSRSTPNSAATQMTEQQAAIPLEVSPNSAHSEATLSGSPRDINGSRSLASPDSPSSHSSPLTNQIQTLPERGDSLLKNKHTLNRKDLDIGGSVKTANAARTLENEYDTPSSAPPTTTTQASAFPAANGIKEPPNSRDSPNVGPLSDVPPPPVPPRGRFALQADPSTDSFVTPRAPPNPPNTAHKIKSESVSTIPSSSSRSGEYHATSPKSSRYTNGVESGADEDGARTLSEDSHQDQNGFLRRVSNSVRHARSYSDRGVRHSKEQKWPRSPLVSSGTHSPALAQGISSPLNASPDGKEELRWFKNELRRERQKTLEQEQKMEELEAALEAKTSIKQMNTELREKRSTMVVLDTQKEIVVRELEVLTEHIAAAKKTGEPLDIGQLSNAVLREFAESLQKLKDSFAPQIEDLTQQRNDLLDDVSNITQLKDKSFQEFEQLSLKNAQLAELNNQLVHQIQELYKANAGPPLDIVRPPPNELGIYTPHSKDKPGVSTTDVRDTRPSLADSNVTGSTVIQEHDAAPATYLPAPQVVNIRKAQPKKFNWKKGGHNVAKGVTKGLKAAFNDGNRIQREDSHTEGMPYGQMQQQEYPVSSLPKNQKQDRQQGLGAFFANQKERPQQFKNSPNGSIPSMPTVSTDGGPLLFGSELEERAEYERVNIPGIVMRCIQEVDARGMDIEGIYRKSGGNSQIQAVKEGFERSNDFDISDPDLDINAVTSTLKQYFRRLPTPLITYEVYDKLIDTIPLPGQDIDPSHPAHPQNPNNHNYRISSTRHAINDLPSHHRDTLEVLMFHLARVVEQQSENLMTSTNVAVVFAPTVMRPESLHREMSDTQQKNTAVQFLIENCQAVFLGDGRSERD